MRYLILISTLVFSTSTLATDNTSQNPVNNFNKHIVGVGYGLNFAVNADDDESDELGLGSSSFFYEYRFDESFSLNTKYHWGKSSGFESEDNFETNGLQLAMKAQTNFIGNLSGYARLGANIYDTKTGFEEDLISKSGVGFIAAAGFEYKTDIGFLLGIETEYFTAGSFDLLGINLLVGYSF